MRSTGADSCDGWKQGSCSGCRLEPIDGTLYCGPVLYEGFRSCKGHRQRLHIQDTVVDSPCQSNTQRWLKGSCGVDDGWNRWNRIDPVQRCKFRSCTCKGHRQRLHTIKNTLSMYILANTIHSCRLLPAGAWMGTDRPSRWVVG